MSAAENASAAAQAAAEAAKNDSKEAQERAAIAVVFVFVCFENNIRKITSCFFFL